MDELDKALAIAVTGPIGEKARQAFRVQMAAWDMAPPPKEPLVLDFGLGRFDAIGLTECWIANEAEAGYCGKYMFVFDGQRCPMHYHREKHETFFVIRGDVEMTVAGEVRIMHPGNVVPIDPGVLHTFKGIGPALLLELSKPCVIDDNYFENTDIPIGDNYQPNA